MGKDGLLQLLNFSTLRFEASMTFAGNLGLAAAALMLEEIVGYPPLLLRTLGHPVAWIGALIGTTERMLNRPSTSPIAQKLLGVVGLFVWLMIAFASGVLLTWACRGVLGWVILIALATSLLAQRALYEHVCAVAEALERNGIVAGRLAVSRIVGRETNSLDEAGVARAAIESLAENFSDGVLAPAFWLAVGGLTGVILYKAVNTADSMIGHRTPRFVNFGWASARFDDLVNLLPARLAALLIVSAAAFSGVEQSSAALRAAWRDARAHLSPNAGWPEAAMAGALGLKLGGPRVYEERTVAGAFMGDGRKTATSEDIYRALKLFRRAASIQILGYAVLALIFIWRD